MRNWPWRRRGVLAEAIVLEPAANNAGKHAATDIVVTLRDGRRLDDVDVDGLFAALTTIESMENVSTLWEWP